MNSQASVLPQWTPSKSRTPGWELVFWWKGWQDGRHWINLPRTSKMEWEAILVKMHSLFHRSTGGLLTSPFHKELSKGHPENRPPEGHSDILVPNRNILQESLVSGKKHGGQDPKGRKNIFLFKPKIIKSTLHLMKGFMLLSVTQKGQN